MILEEHDRPIGSFFESAPELSLQVSSTPPWERAAPVQYVQTGRQALAALAEVLEQEGRDTLLVPAYLCDSMIESFAPERWALRPYEVSERIEIVPEELERLGRECDPSRTAALTIAYFGNEPNVAHVQAVQHLQQHGVRVIEDETHRVLGELTPLGDYGVASLRKVLPVADGAYVRGLVSTLPLGDRPHRGWEAMDLKRDGDLAGARDAFSEAHEVLESADVISPAQASTRTLQTIRELDYDFMRSQRRLNAQALQDSLSLHDGVRLVAAAGVPSHVVIQVDDAKRTQAALAERSIFCPIHWPQPSRMQSSDWRWGLLSLPVDHRYDRADMERMSATLGEVLL